MKRDMTNFLFDFLEVFESTNSLQFHKFVSIIEEDTNNADFMKVFKAYLLLQKEYQLKVDEEFIKNGLNYVRIIDNGLESFAHKYMSIQNSEFFLDVMLSFSELVKNEGAEIVEQFNKKYGSENESANQIEIFVSKIVNKQPLDDKELIEIKKIATFMSDKIRVATKRFVQKYTNEINQYPFVSEKN